MESHRTDKGSKISKVTLTRQCHFSGGGFYFFQKEIKTVGKRFLCGEFQSAENFLEGFLCEKGSS